MSDQALKASPVSSVSGKITTLWFANGARSSGLNIWRPPQESQTKSGNSSDRITAVFSDSTMQTVLLSDNR